jgi:hypothetical protein
VTRQDFDELYADYTATADFPGAMFPRKRSSVPTHQRPLTKSLPDELFAAYSDAKFILTTRDVASWKASTQATIYEGGTNPVMRFAPWFRTPHRKMAEIIMPIWSKFFRGRFLEDGEAIFEEHSALVKGLIPTEQLLTYEVKEGWGLLCAFMGVPVPVREACYGVRQREAERSPRPSHSRT